MELRKHLKSNDPTPVGRYLGCEQHNIEMSSQDSRVYLEHMFPVVFKDMLEEGSKKWPDMIPKNAPIRAVEYDMREFVGSCVDRYCELSGKSRSTLKNVECPGVDDQQLKPENFEMAGELPGDASKLIMKLLYGARTCRWDLQHDCNSLASEVSKWNNKCDIRLHKLSS